MQAAEQSGCEDKVLNFLFGALGSPVVLPPQAYNTLFQEDFQKLYNSPDRDRPNGPHIATPRPSRDKPPIFPNVDTDVNPFGCDAFARKFDAGCCPNIPGPTAASVITGTNEPPKQSWHSL